MPLDRRKRSRRHATTGQVLAGPHHLLDVQTPKRQGDGRLLPADQPDATDCLCGSAAADGRGNERLLLLARTGRHQICPTARQPQSGQAGQLDCLVAVTGLLRSIGCFRQSFPPTDMRWTRRVEANRFPGSPQGSGSGAKWHPDDALAAAARWPASAFQKSQTLVAGSLLRLIGLGSLRHLFPKVDD